MMAETKGMRVASYLVGSNKVTINPRHVAYLQQARDKTRIVFDNETTITVDSPIEIVENDLFPERLAK
jgi:hypothetical protein